MLKKLLKMAAATVALLILKRRIAIAAAAVALGSALTVGVATAGTNLVVNGDFQSYHNVYAPYGRLQLPVPNAWATINPEILSMPSNPDLLEWGTNLEDSYIRLGTAPNGQNFYLNALSWAYPDPAPSGVVLSQVISGLIPGHSYQLSFLSSGVTLTSPPTLQGGIYFMGYPTPGWRVTFGTSGNTTSFNGNSIPSVTDFPKVGSWFDNMTWIGSSMKFVATATSETLSFSNVLAKMFSGDFSGGAPFSVPCVPCVGPVLTQYQTLANVQMVDAGPAAAAPTLTVQKALGTGGRINANDQFTVQIVQNGSTVVNSTTNSTTTGSNATVNANTGTTGSTTLTPGTSYLVSEVASGSTNLASYSAALACTNATSGSSTVMPTSLNQTFTTQAGDAISCTVTNTPKAPSIRLTKALGAGGRANNADQFTVLVQQRLSTIASGTSTGSGGVISAGSTGWTNLVAGTSYNLGEVMASGSASNLAAYTGVLSCSNALAGSSTVLPTAPGAAFTPTYGDVLDCTLTNTPKPATLTVTQKVIVTAPATFNPPLTLSYTGTNGWTLQKNNSTVLNTVTTGATQTLAALKLATTLTVAVSTSEIGWKIASIRCTDTNAAVSGNPLPPTILVSSTNNTIVIPANVVSAGAALQCAVIGSRQI